MARRGKTPPYELMRSVDRPTGGGDAPPTPPAASSSSAGADEAGGAGGVAGGWSWSGVGVPIVVRVPRGVAVLIAVGLIALVVLAYWVGHQRGDAAGAERMRAELTESPVATGREAPGPPPGAVAGAESQPVDGVAAGEGGGEPAQAAGRADADEGTAARSDGGVYEAGAEDDPRVAGLNYMIVATYDPPNARELAAFLAEDHGLETVLRPVNNGDRIQVWVVDQGFTGQELGREAYLAYRSELREVGRAWRQHQPALRDALEQMYPTRYDP